MGSMPSAPLVRTIHSDVGKIAPRSEAVISIRAIAWLTAITIAFALDRPLATFLHRSGIDDAVKFGGLPIHVIKLAGLCWYTLIVAIALLIWHPSHWRAAVFECTCCILAGANSIVKWMAGRTRPFKLTPINVAQPFHWSWFAGGGRGLFHQSSDLSFVSGHTAVAFATAAGLAILLPRQRMVVAAAYGIAAMLLAERVLENAHWLSDAVCGAALGVWGATLLQWIAERWAGIRWAGLSWTGIRRTPAAI